RGSESSLQVRWLEDSAVINRCRKELIRQIRRERIGIVHLSSPARLIADHTPVRINQTHICRLVALVVRHTEENTVPVVDVPVEPSCCQPLPVERNGVDKSRIHATLRNTRAQRPTSRIVPSSSEGSAAKIAGGILQRPSSSRHRNCLCISP